MMMRLMSVVFVYSMLMLTRIYKQRHQQFLDGVSPFKTGRWVIAFLSLVLFMYRIFALQVSE